MPWVRNADQRVFPGRIRRVHYRGRRRPSLVLCSAMQSMGLERRRGGGGHRCCGPRSAHAGRQRRRREHLQYAYARWAHRCRTLADFRVPVRTSTPHRRRLLAHMTALQGPYWPVSTTTAACSERRCTSSGGLLPSPGYVNTYNPPFRSSFIFAANSVRQTKSCGRLTTA